MRSSWNIAPPIVPIINIGPEVEQNAHAFFASDVVSMPDSYSSQIVLAPTGYPQSILKNSAYALSFGALYISFTGFSPSLDIAPTAPEYVKSNEQK